ncbi:MAG: hypothetical protein R2704_04030 [Microthrixaceae bacterium]
MIRNLAIGGAIAVGAAGVGLGWTVQQRVLTDDRAVGAVVDVPGDTDGDGVVSAAEMADVPSAIYFDCPGGSPTGALHDGDRILAVAKHDRTDGWVALRRPREPQECCGWPASRSCPMRISDALPTRPCSRGPGVDLAAAQATTTTTNQPTSTTAGDEVAAAADDATSTTAPSGADGDPNAPQDPALPGATGAVPDGSDDAAPAPNAPATGAPTPGVPVPDVPAPDNPAPNPPATAPQTTTAPTPAPSVDLYAPNPGTINERYSNGGYSCGGPSTALVRATISGASSASMSWSIGGRSGSSAMTPTGGDLWQVVLGSFDEHTLGTGSATVQVEITAQGPGGSTGRSTTVTLNDCTFG